MSPELETTKHPFFETISKEIANSDQLQPLLNEVNTQLEKHNVNKLISTTKLLQNVIEYLPTPSKIPNLFIPNYIHHTLNHLRSLTTATKNDLLHQSLTGLLNTTSTAFQLSEDGEPKLAFVRKLLFNPGTFSFERITKIKVLQQIALQLDRDSVKKLAKMYIDAALDEKKRLTDRIYAVQMFVKVLGHSAVQDELEWRIEQLGVLLDNGVFEGDGAVKEDLASECSIFGSCHRFNRFLSF